MWTHVGSSSRNFLCWCLEKIPKTIHYHEAMKPAYPTNLCPWMHLRRPGIRRRREICSWPRSVQTRPSGTTSWRPAGTCWSRCCSSSCWCCYSSTWEPPRARLQAPLISSGRMASKTLWNSSAGRQEAANQNLISVPESHRHSVKALATKTKPLTQRILSYIKQSEQ